MNNYRIRSLFQDLREALQAHYEQQEATVMAEWVIEAVSGYAPTALLIHGDERLLPDQVARFRQYKKELLAGRPVQYVLGSCIFAGLTIRVNESVLIPRPETEELVQWCLETLSALPNNEQPVLLDIGTGSGCIALSLKHQYPAARVYAADIAPAALAVASANAAAHHLSITFLERDVLDPPSWRRLPECDVIISNPPYISREELDEIAPAVRNYEPHEALFVTDGDPLQFYKAIAIIAADRLKPEGRLFLEAHAAHAGAVFAYFQSKGWHGIVKKDLQGKDRMLCLHRQGS